uniref:Uncharacterized protein n=1 Tax=Oryza rufipogon TaxID=4529 RepID=A0A0E0RBT2_ORYRU
MSLGVPELRLSSAEAHARFRYIVFEEWDRAKLTLSAASGGEGSGGGATESTWGRILGGGGVAVQKASRWRLKILRGGVGGVSRRGRQEGPRAGCVVSGEGRRRRRWRGARVSEAYREFATRSVGRGAVALAANGRVAAGERGGGGGND